MKLGELISQYRISNNISQREFARRCGLSNSLISLIEKGVNPQTGKTMAQDLETYSRIAYAMGISVQELFEQLGTDASVRLYPAQVIGRKGLHIAADPKPPKISGDTDTITVHSPITEEQQELIDQLEDLHQNPRLRLLFDRTRKMSEDDVDFMIQMADRILREQDGE